MKINIYNYWITLFIYNGFHRNNWQLNILKHLYAEAEMLQEKMNLSGTVKRAVDPDPDVFLNADPDPEPTLQSL